MSVPQTGAPAPDVIVADTQGNSVALSDYWRDQPIVLAFLRHFG